MPHEPNRNQFCTIFMSAFIHAYTGEKSFCEQNIISPSYCSTSGGDLSRTEGGSSTYTHYTVDGVFAESLLLKREL